jgi:TRAP-type C4-dicarboxylate transport system substrate-binding protein
MLNRRMMVGLASATALSVMGLGLGATTAAAQEVTLRMHQFLPAQANVPKYVLDVWADKIEADSNGRIKIQRFPSMQLGGTPPQLVDQVIDGVADIIWTVNGYTPGRFPQTEVFELPFMMTNAEATSRAFWELASEKMMDTDFKDVHVLGLWVHGPGVIHSKAPITTVADLNGVKLRAPTRVTNMMFSALGATPVGMPVPAVPEALSKGVIDATVIPWEVTGALKVAELVGNHTEFGDASLYTTTFMFAMNKDVYGKLPDDLKAVIDANSGEEFSALAGKVMQDYDAPSRQIAVDRGNTIIELSADQVNDWRAASQGTIDTWVAEMDAKGLDGTGLLAEAQALIAKYTTE